MNSFSKAFLRLEESMIDSQYDIDKLEAGKEFHQQKLRLIHIQLDEKNEELIISRRRFDRLDGHARDE
ncbi:MAG: hypothetical protein HOB51_07070 [Thaumarchaeota archaeon]|jgi:hypothetical protein|nr:hypothetical protein [Nitrososphaerota archaeon]